MFERINQSLLSNWWWKIDKLTLLIIILLIIFGGIALSSASIAVERKIDVASSFFIKKQIFYIGCAIILLFLTSLLSIEFIKSFALYIYLFTLVLVVGTLLFGIEIKGSKRWVSILNFSMQPSEFMKITMAILNAKILNILKDTDNGNEELVVYLISFLLCILSIGLLASQPDIGMCCLIFCTWIAQVFISGISLSLLLIPVSIFTVCAGSAYFFFDHVHYRINNFILGISSNNTMYQIKKATETFTHGGLFGVGPWQGKFKFSLPDSHTDFIFSVIAEEFGIILCILLIVIYAFIAIRAIRTVIKSYDLFSILVVIGLSVQFISQTMINIGVNIQLLPAKGMTLPFISYGGSSIISSAILIGIILSFNKKQYINTPKVGLLYNS
jgi:cell division protein FtsW